MIGPKKTVNEESQATEWVLTNKQLIVHVLTLVLAVLTGTAGLGTSIIGGKDGGEKSEPSAFQAQMIEEHDEIMDAIQKIESSLSNVSMQNLMLHGGGTLSSFMPMMPTTSAELGQVMLDDSLDVPVDTEDPQ